MPGTGTFFAAQFLPGTGTGCSTAAHCLWIVFARLCVNALSGLYLISTVPPRIMLYTLVCFNALMGLSCYEQRITGAEESISFNALMGLSCYLSVHTLKWWSCVSMPSWAWVVTARISNILNFSWYFLCIPAIYKCILAYLPIFFNQLSKFLRCESPSTFLGTCLSHHSFIIFLVTNTNTLFSGLYLISTMKYFAFVEEGQKCQCPLGLIPHFYGTPSKT